MSHFPSARELAEEARAALRAQPDNPGELFQQLIDWGFINAILFQKFYCLLLDILA